jgi:formate hydrogenlyase subunit 4
MSTSPLALAGVSAVQLGAAVIGGPLLYGLMAKVRARAEGRAGAPVRQPLLDLRKLASKERIHAEHSSAVLPLAPLVLIASTAAAVVIAPLISTGPALGRTADAFVIVFLLLLGSVAVALGGLDAGTAFGGMGSSRAMTIGALAEPALLVAVVALSIQAHTSNLPGIVSATLAHPGVGGEPGAGARPLRPCHRRVRGGGPDPGRQSRHPSRADDDPRGDGPRIRGS